MLHTSAGNLAVVLSPSAACASLAVFGYANMHGVDHVTRVLACAGFACPYSNC